jgi:hypothetical protein
MDGNQGGGQSGDSQTEIRASQQEEEAVVMAGQEQIRIKIRK